MMGRKRRTLAGAMTRSGLSPIIFETSRQAPFLIPMAISIGFGILFATPSILVIVPSIRSSRTSPRSAEGSSARRRSSARRETRRRAGQPQSGRLL